LQYGFFSKHYSYDFSLFTLQILHLLGNEGPKTADPSKYIRYVYNRVILENATVRASAVSALARFGVVVEELRPRILILLRRCLYDNDDEVPNILVFRVLNIFSVMLPALSSGKFLT
jgi:hypothetical protein